MDEKSVFIPVILNSVGWYFGDLALLSELLLCFFRMAMELEGVEKFPAFFTCTSGEFLWGQLHTVIEGSDAEGSDAEGSDAEGSDAEGSFRFKVAARKGGWKAEAAFMDNYKGQPWHVGFVCHHVDVDGLEILRRAAEAGIGGDGKFGALEIVYVNRDDWSGSHSPGCELIVQAVEGKTVDPEEDEFDDESYYRSLVDGRFMLVDKLGFDSLIQALKDGKKLERKNYILKKEEGTGGKKVEETGGKKVEETGGKKVEETGGKKVEETGGKKVEETRGKKVEETGGKKEEETGGKKDTVEEAFGVHLVVNHSEYDLGWMAFRNGELVGFVYDGAYSGLEGNNLRLGN